ncbi:helix-turn-helix domain-containing protein [Paenibacillus sp. LMG 31458]|uniref:Helix-turn-helix domain-containing protein n=1 Tax=Paenibacillus phytorum TaxID=2654977 RepID=A0ABX1XRL8_9BACL|nr:DNA-binding transcriptional regulator [Paenibacillus phytorum]NOU71132.1 helix-turn-helix domain-containing protein [Paenibacillus phytorum]
MSLFTSGFNENVSITNPQQKQVALLIETSNGYARGLLSGINTYLRENRPWSIFLSEYSRNNTDLTWLREWQGDGIIARIENEQTARFIKDAGLPTVDLSASRMIPSLPYVETNDQSIAQLAAEHFLERGFKHIGFYGDSRFRWSNLRCTYLAACLAERGHYCHIYEASENLLVEKSWKTERDKLVQWLYDLPKPIGIMACYDICGQQLLEACRIAQIAVPDEVAVLGVDDDELLCELSNPPLSSIKTNAVKTGYQAAELLERMMSGEVIGAQMHLIEPLNVHVRLSTDVLAIEDKMVSDAVRFIRNHAYDDIQVQDILEQLKVSRRILESRFQKALGRTPHDEIINVKLKLVKKLLLDTKLSLAVIAERIGFKHTEYMSVVFKRATGIRPGQFRQQNKHRIQDL